VFVSVREREREEREREKDLDDREICPYLPARVV
jgi:hypothetical protein